MGESKIKMEDLKRKKKVEEFRNYIALLVWRSYTLAVFFLLLLVYFKYLIVKTVPFP